MFSLKEAQKKVLLTSALLKEKKIPSGKSFNYIIAEDIFCNIDLPSSDISMVSGYALRAEDVIGADENYPVKLTLLESKEFLTSSITPGYCIQVKANDLIPEGATSILPKDEADSDGKDVFIFRECKIGENVKKKGSNLKIDDLIIAKGRTIFSKELVLLSMIGKEKIKVYKRPKTSVVSISDDNRNKTTTENLLVSKTIESGAESSVIDFPMDSINEKELNELLKKRSEKFDIMSFIIQRDHKLKHRLLKSFESIGIKMIFKEVNQNPASDITYLKYNNTMIFVLFDSLFEIEIYFEMFLKPIIQKMTGSNEMFSNIIWVKPLSEIDHKKGKTTFFRVKIEKKSNEYFARIMEDKEDNIFNILSMDGIAMVSEDEAHIGLDSRLKVYLLKSMEKLA